MNSRIIATIFGIAAIAGWGVSADGPPVNALRRYDPEKYQVSIDVSLDQISATSDAAKKGYFNIKEAPIIMPVIYMGQYSKVFPNSENSTLMLDSKPIRGYTTRISDNRPFNTHHLEMVMPSFVGQNIRWSITYTTQSWSADINEAMAQRSTWPRDLEWPTEVRDGLKRQMFIESDDPIVSAVIREETRNTDLRAVSPYIAAKQIMAYVLNRFQVSGVEQAKGVHGQLRGMNIRGAKEVIANPDPAGRWIGTSHDLVCVYVALLRAAGIPARPVVGITEERGVSGRKTTKFISWVEFYLPDSGWVPVDPERMKSAGPGKYRSLTAKWEDFGDIEDLNERIPLSYHFIPPSVGAVSPGYAAVWGWDPRPAQLPYYEQSVRLQITGRGKGEEDPR